MVEPTPVVPVIPFLDQWVNSGHADKTAEAFVHWNEDDPAEVPESCARCHSGVGYQDFIGADGSEAGVVDQPAPIGSVITCDACHNAATVMMTSVVFPSGIEVTGLGPEARCMQCHQGRYSKVGVDEAIANAGITDNLDEVSPDLGFANIHYYAAAATLYGTVVKGGYEYDGKAYDAKFDHVAGYDTCASCHSPHTLEVKVAECQTCHTNVETVEDLKDVRMQGSLVDYNGNGDREEGIYHEVTGMQETLMMAIQAYAREVAGQPIAYDTARYPYFFIDANDNGQVDEDETGRYDSWTARLAKAAYNYQVSLKDPGFFAHGGKYIIELLYDSTEDLNGSISEPIDMTNMHRIDAGHFAGSEEAFRHWDEDGEVSGSCSRCHSAAGLPLFIEQGVTINQPTANGLNCATCHNDLTTFTRYEVEEVPFPSGATLTLGEPDANLCINCHQGRESTVSVDRLIGDLGADEQSDRLRFLNVHYFAAGATLFGTEAKGAYEFTGQVYAGRNEHVAARDTCIECHDTHLLEVQIDECVECHENVVTRADLVDIRVSEDDFDGDGDVTEGLAGEIATMQEALYTAMQSYATDTIGTGIVYSDAAYPYFFTDTNSNGTVDADEATRSNGYNTWTPALLRAAYNYQYVAKDPGAFAHNGKYILQILYDSLNSLGADTTNMIRP
ncbi:MAG: cytochrome c3 family protein [Ardenticatenales bacterium]|nr:cytochrome c3 family protein [Ardenticatenales bacterium]